MNIFYFIHITGTDSGISGVPRVVRNLARELVSRPDITLTPVRWSESLGGIVHAEQRLLDNLSRSGGPEIEEPSLSPRAISPEAGDWLLIPEVPHLQSHLSDYAPVLIDSPIGYARRSGLKVAVIVHDILPLSHPPAENRKRLFADLASDGDEVQRLRFVGYAHALALVDLILPVSRTTGDLLARWLVQHGHEAKRLPPVTPVVLPEQVFGVARAAPRPQPEKNGPIEFLCLGTISAHKNQLSAMSAFLRLIERRPELDLRLNMVGQVTPALAVPVSLLAKRAKGRIVLHGWLPDSQIRTLVRRARATVFVSLAEGYGLPVAESLWYGKPCLCSGEGSTGEIARGGGCLTVNPGSLDEIEAGFETLATDASRYEQLLDQVAARSMRTWKQYAGEIVGELSALSSGEPRRSALASDVDRALEDAAADEEGERDSIVFIAASDLSVPADFAATSDRRRSIHRGSAIRYDWDHDGDIQQDVLFFGPYIPFPAGAYAFSFEGEIEGELAVAFTGNSGRTKIGEASLDSFTRSVSIDLSEPVEKFEIVGMKTPGLKRLILRGAFAHLREHAPRRPNAPIVGSTDSGAAEPEASILGVEALQGDDDSRIKAIDDEGQTIALPCDLPAEKMRVHDDALRVDGSIVFNRRISGFAKDPVLFFGPYLHLEPGPYHFRFNGSLDGALRIRITRNFSSETLREILLTSFDAPVALILEEPAEKVEIIGERTKQTKAMTLRSIGIAVEPLTAENRIAPDAHDKRSLRLVELAARFLLAR